MKYISIDIETTGLDFWENQILQIGMVFEDTDADLPLGNLPQLEIFVENKQLSFQEAALKMHTESGLLDEYFAMEKTPLHEVVLVVMNWLDGLGYSPNDEGQFEIVVAGKNYNAFDKMFLAALPAWTKRIKEHRRTLDPAILYVEWDEDEVPPNLSTCLQRMSRYQNIDLDYETAHDAIEDAIDVIRVIRAIKDPLVYNKVGF